MALLLSVAADGSGDFARIQDAVDAIPDGRAEAAEIRIRPGVYREKLFIDKPHIRLIGEDAERTVIVYSDCARKLADDGEPLHTFNSYTAFIGADHVTAERLTFVNDAGRGEEVGQAVAAYVDGDRAVFRQCRFIGHQDTLFTGPLPPKPRERASFGGPRDSAPRRPVRQYYEDCYIRGDIDFIFGSATAVFYRCEIAPSRSGWITAASTPENAEFGYVFVGCRLAGDAPAQSVYLGRPWRSFAKVAFLHCYMGESIRPEGWDRWDGRDDVAATLFAEFDCTGPGSAADKRAEWTYRLTAEEARRFAIDRVLAGSDGWKPSGAADPR